MKRGNDYYMARLIIEDPGIYADYVAGKFPSKRAAFIAAGLIKVRSRVHAIVQAIKNASLAEIKEAILIIKARRAVPSLPAMIPVPVSIVDKDLRLTPNAKSEIERIYLLRKLKPGQAMTEMGLNPLNVSIGNARIGGRIKNINTVKKLADWLELNKL